MELIKIFYSNDCNRFFIRFCIYVFKVLNIAYIESLTNKRTKSLLNSKVIYIMNINYYIQKN